MRNGEYVMNPRPGGSQKSYVYSDGRGNDQTDGRVANPNNYLMVPADYTEQKAKDFAAQIADIIGRVYPEDEMGAAGLHQALGQMIGAFSRGGSQDLQRHPQWGIPKGSVVSGVRRQCVQPSRICDWISRLAYAVVRNRRRRSQRVQRDLAIH
jgi:hypothetical protein